TFFTHPTIAGVSEVLEEDQQGGSYEPIARIQESDSYALTASQHRLWILSQLDQGSLAYNMPAAVILSGHIDQREFEASFRALIARHEILRTVFRTNEQNEIRQYILPEDQVNFRISHEDFSSHKNQQEAILASLHQKNNELFDLANGPLIRGSLLKQKQDQYVFLLSLHHIIADGWSMELLLSEIVQLYNSL
ncbi:hypothetical protein KHA90_25150, partial [Flavobacterium psychroterrae]